MSEPPHQLVKLQTLRLCSFRFFSREFCLQLRDGFPSVKNLFLRTWNPEMVEILHAGFPALKCLVLEGMAEVTAAAIEDILTRCQWRHGQQLLIWPAPPKSVMTATSRFLAGLDERCRPSVRMLSDTDLLQQLTDATGWSRSSQTFLSAIADSLFSFVHAVPTPEDQLHAPTAPSWRTAA
eukprot:NODE_1340_length_992_cov_181.978791_g876_i1.p1 GENE.NODE_1340_length_992_cov_181.978791_g876_i1~~NODE_1340_length_992_cov_181.978791_g876_i1.p1  ORF type:complete len:180 (+),score=28.97 NODE_1340_length_992_cov_181.978791_g876_i1:206-745(+)